MTADYAEITESNRTDILGYLEHIITDLHEALEKLEAIGKLTREHDALLTEFRPLLEQFRSPAAAYMTRRASRRNGNG
jgi:hypothetical protein